MVVAALAAAPPHSDAAASLTLRDTGVTGVDLDGPSLTRTLCRGQRGPLVSDVNRLELVPGELATAGRWAAATTSTEGDAFGRVQLQRCGHRTRTLRRCRTTFCQPPVLDDRLVAREERARRGRGPVTLTVRWHRSGRVRRATSDAYGLTPLLVGDRLYVVQARPLGTQPLAPVQLRLLRARL